MKTRDVLEQVYDTLMQNTDYEQFNVDNIEAPEIDYEKNTISFWIGTKQYTFTLTVKTDLVFY